MRRWLVVLAILACVPVPANAADKADTENKQPKAGQTVQFDGETLTLAYEGEQSGDTIKEFLPAGQKLDSWTKLAAIRQYAGLDDPLALAAQTIKQLKKDYPLSPSSIIQNPKTGEVIVDFVVWPEDASFVEFNIFKYRRRPGGGLTTEQYALRSYRDQEGFLKGLRPVRARLVELMAAKGLESAAAGEPRQVKTGRVSP
jgi:hypothetical protein